MSEVTKETLDEIIRRIDENIIEVKIQTTKTNGSVRALQLWKAKAHGAIVVISIVMTGVIIPLVLKYLSISLFG
jgi:hypothetical protein